MHRAARRISIALQGFVLQGSRLLPLPCPHERGLRWRALAMLERENLTTTIPPDTLLRLYRMMYLIRRTEEILMSEYHPADEMRCPMHFCVGQEAMPAALSFFVRRSDVLMSEYRSHGYYLAKGAPLDAMVAEFYGKATGANFGIAGSMGLGAHDYNFYSGAIVAGSLFIPFGIAFSQQFRSVDDISIAVIGDGVFDEGITYEIFNLAHCIVCRC